MTRLEVVMAAEGGGLPAENGASRTRTGDLLGAIQALSQLSYSPAATRVAGIRALLSTKAGPVVGSARAVRLAARPC
jgi:hypothetical protein